jgi:TalC/MipB family fructose-6-phosphate aldolase
LYLDTASLAEVREIVRLGILDGVALNTSSVSDQGLSLHQGLHEICSAVDQPIRVSELSIEEEAIVKEGKEFAKLHGKIIVKCPLTPAGLKATARLAADGIPVNVSLCFSLMQALIATKAGAWDVSLCFDRTETVNSKVVALFVQLSRCFGILGSPLRCFSRVSVRFRRRMRLHWQEGIFVQYRSPCGSSFLILGSMILLSLTTTTNSEYCISDSARGVVDFPVCGSLPSFLFFPI